MHRFLMKLVSPNNLGTLAFGLLLVAVAMLAASSLQPAMAAEDAPAAKAAEAPAEPATPSDQGKPAGEADKPAPSDEPVPADAKPAEDTPSDQQADASEEPASESAEDETPFAKQIGTTTTTLAEEEKTTNWGPLLLFAAVIFGSFFLAAGVASSLRVKEYQAKLSIIFLSLFAAAAIVWSGWPPKLGIDLKGGVYLVYETGEKAQATLADAAATDLEEDQDAASKGLSSSDMDKLVSAISRRINPGGVKEVVIRPFGQNQIEIVIPEVDESEIERYKEKITSAGTLEFRILANNNDHRELIDDARKSDAQFVYRLDADGKPMRDENGAPMLRGWWGPSQRGRRERKLDPDV